MLKDNKKVITIISAPNAILLKKVFNFNIKRMISSGLIKTKENANEIISLGLNWMTVVEKCKFKKNVLHLTIGKDDINKTLNIFSMKNFNEYMYNGKKEQEKELYTFIWELSKALKELLKSF
jgi:hypothetical protein